MLRRGFALLEVLLVVAIIGAAAGIGVPLYRDYQVRTDLNLATEQVTQGLARARLLAQSGQNDDSWGFYVPGGVLYKGTSYEFRDTAFDEFYPMPSTITTSDLLEVNYSKVQGVPNITGEVTLSAITDDTRTILIEVKTESVAVIQGDNLAICHYTGGQNPHTIHISDSAWPAHMNHGDTLGACPVASASSASSAPASSSRASSLASISSSVANSSVASAGQEAGCPDRFTIEPDGTIVTTGDLTITYRVSGADITYGQGGPEIAVTLKYSKNGGNSYSNLFSGNDVDGGESQTTNQITAGAEIVTSFRGYYKKQGWLTFDKTYYTNDESGHVIALQDGDPLPDYPAFDDQDELEDYLADILDAEGNINIESYEIVYLVELGALNTSASDFQDAVVRVRFNNPSC